MNEIMLVLTVRTGPNQAANGKGNPVMLRVIACKTFLALLLGTSIWKAEIMSEATKISYPGELDVGSCSTGKPSQALRGIGARATRTFFTFGSLFVLAMSWAYADSGVAGDGPASSAQGKAGPATDDTVVAEPATLDKARTEETTAYCRGLVESYLTWSPPNNTFDSENPFRVKLLEADREALGKVFREMYAEPFRAIPLKLIWLWGELGAIESVPLLDLLLQEYSERPSPRTAISIGSALGTLNVTMLGDYGFTDEELRAIWKAVLGTRWPAMQDKSIDEIVAYWRMNWVEVREDCKRRSVPELG